MNIIPNLRKAGYFVERVKRPLSRGVKYRVWQAPDKTIAVAYSLDELGDIASALIRHECPDTRVRVMMPGSRAALVRPRCKYL